MNGPQHYREAEAMLAVARQSYPRDEGPYDRMSDAELIAAAQVHATLALAAATALAVARPDYRGRGAQVVEWMDALGVAGERARPTAHPGAFPSEDAVSGF